MIREVGVEHTVPDIFSLPCPIFMPEIVGPAELRCENLLNARTVLMSR
jgi:hypothetical protein